jgi:hypothetical protein
VDAVRTAAGTLPVGIDLPWWLTERSAGSGTVFDAVIQHVDSVPIEYFTPAVAGGAQFTFYDEGAGALATETAAAAAAFAGQAGFTGISVEHLLSWKALLAR